MSTNSDRALIGEPIFNVSSRKHYIMAIACYAAISFILHFVTSFLAMENFTNTIFKIINHLVNMVYLPMEGILTLLFTLLIYSRSFVIQSDFIKKAVIGYIIISALPSVLFFIKTAFIGGAIEKLPYAMQHMIFINDMINYMGFDIGIIDLIIPILLIIPSDK